MTIDQIIGSMRTMQQDTQPDGWPPVQMRDIAALCDEVAALRGQRAVLAGWVREGLEVLGTIDPDECEDGGRALAEFKQRGVELVGAVQRMAAPDGPRVSRPNVLVCGTQRPAPLANNTGGAVVAPPDQRVKPL